MNRTWLGGAIVAAGPASVAAAADFHEIFEARCLGCHSHAGEFARGLLTEDNGVLKGARSGHEMASYLPGRARITAGEADRMLEALTGLRSGAR